MSAPIVVATDGSQLATVAVFWAAEEALRHERVLRIAHVMENAAYDIPLTTPPGHRISVTDRGMQVLAVAATLVSRHHPALAVETRLVRGSVTKVLRAEASGAFELVVGSRGLGAVAGTLLGSVSRRLVGHSESPVVVVRTDPQVTHRTVVVGIDPDQESCTLLAYAFEAASVRDAALRVVSAWQPSPSLVEAGLSEDLVSLERGRLNAITTAIAAWRNRYPDVKVIEQAPYGSTAGSLVHAGRDADLLVVGTGHHRSPGPVGYGLLHRAPCPTAFVHPRVPAAVGTGGAECAR